MSRTCQFPGCSGDLSGRVSNTKYCLDHARQMNSRRNRKVVRGKAVRTYAHGDPWREKQKMCFTCFNQPWRRTPSDYNEVSGDGTHRRMVTEGDWKCKGCGEPYAPEPPIERGSVIGSSAGAMVDHGSLHGHEILVHKHQGKNNQGSKR